LTEQGGLELITLGGSGAAVVAGSNAATADVAAVSQPASNSPNNDSASLSASVLQQSDDPLHRTARRHRQ
jgi:hypothetical protein